MRSLVRLAMRSDPAFGWGFLFLVRIAVGLIFILAAVRKFTEPEEMGPGRFEGLGFAWPEFWAYWVGFWELLGGVLVLIGLLTRAAAIPLAVTMVFAIWLTKVPRFGEEELVLILHASRLDFAMLLCALFLMFAGGGRFAVDRVLEKK